jgi:uncharacterized protein YbjT (DUF2867 family)
VQYSIRLLVPEGSLLLGRIPDLGPWDAAALTYRWTSPLDDLQAELAALVEASTDRPAVEVFRTVAGAIRAAAGLDPEVGPLDEGLRRPRLTEAWFCCAEPTCGQVART